MGGQGALAGGDVDADYTLVASECAMGSARRQWADLQTDGSATAPLHYSIFIDSCQNHASPIPPTRARWRQSRPSRLINSSFKGGLGLSLTRSGCVGAKQRCFCVSAICTCGIARGAPSSTSAAYTELGKCLLSHEYDEYSMPISHHLHYHHIITTFSD